MIFKSKIKWAALGILVLSLLSLLIHLLLAKYSGVGLVQYSAFTGFQSDFSSNFITRSTGYKKLWGNVKSLESLQPYANPRNKYPVLNDQNNGFIFAKVFGGFEKIRSSICDLVTISRLLNATLVIPEIQQSTRSKGISSRFKSFSYLYNEEQFIAALTNDVVVVKNLPDIWKEARKRNEFPIFKPKSSTSSSFYLKEVLPKLKMSKVIGIFLTDGGGLQSILPPSMVEYQRLRCRVAFHALHFRPEIQDLGHQMIGRLRAWGQPYLAYHPGLIRDTLAYHGCAEIFQDVHTELIQYRRAQMIKQGVIHEELTADSFARKGNGSCPLMPEEVGLLLRAMGYPPKTIIYLAGSETFGGQRVVTPLRAMFANLVDRTSLCSKQELDNLIGFESPLPPDLFQPPSTKSKGQLEEEWKKAGPRPRPLPPPPNRPIYRHEKEGWYGWITETDKEPVPTPSDLRIQAHRLLWDALDYIVSVEADAYFPGFHNDGSGWPDFSSLVMGHRLYEIASARTYRPDRKLLVGLLNSTIDHLYYPKHPWKLAVRQHLNQSVDVDGLIRESLLSKPTSFLSHPLPECSCRTPESTKTLNPVKDSNNRFLYGGEEQCPDWMQHTSTSSEAASSKEDTSASENEGSDDELDSDDQFKSEDKGNRNDTVPISEQDDEMDPDD